MGDEDVLEFDNDHGYATVPDIARFHMEVQTSLKRNMDVDLIRNDLKDVFLSNYNNKNIKTKMSLMSIQRLLAVQERSKFKFIGQE